MIGICGGFQLLGKEMHDPDGVEHGGTMRGLGILDTKTVFKEAKQERELTDILQKNIISMDLKIFL